MARDLRTSLFGGIGDLGARRPRAVLAVLGLLMVVGLWLGSLLDIKTSRYAMVSADDPEQARMVRFFERFGVPDGLLVVVSGGDVQARRAMVDGLRDAYDQDPNFEGRVLGRIDGRQSAESLLLFSPDSLGEAARAFGREGRLKEAVEGGVPGMLRALEGRLEAGLDGELDSGEGEAPTDGLTRLGSLAEVLADRLEGAKTTALLERLSGAEGEDEGDGGTMPEVEGVDGAGYLVGRSEALNVVALFPAFEGSEVTDYLPIVDAAKRVRDDVVAARGLDGLTVEITGLPMLTADEHRLVADGLVESGVATGLGVFLMLALAFRSFRHSVVTLLPLGVGMGIALGMAYLLVGQLNAVTSGMFAVLLGLGIDFSVHLAARYHEEIRQGGDRRHAAMRAALVRAGPGIVTGAITTSLAFLTVATARFTAYAELGLLTSVGLVVVLSCTLLLLPILARARWLPERSPPVLPGVATLCGAVRRAPRLLASLAIVAAVCGVAAWGQVRFNARYLDFMPEKEESARALDLLERDGGLSPVIAYLGAADLEDARQKTDRLRALESVGEVVTPSDLLPDLGEDDRLARLRGALRDAGPQPDFEALRGRVRRGSELASAARGVVDMLDEVVFSLEQAGRSTASATAARDGFKRLAAVADSLPADGGPHLAAVEGELADLLERAWGTAARVVARGHYLNDDLPPMFRRRHAARDGSQGVAIFVTPATPVWEPGPARAFATDVRGVDDGASGQAINMHVHTQMVQSDFKRAAGYAALLVFIVLLIDFRRLSDAVLAMLPVTMGWGIMLGAMALLEVAMNLANIVVLPLVLGIGIDAGVHIVHRCRQSAAEEPDRIARLETLLEGTGGAVIVSTLTTMIGFAGLTIPDHRGMQSLGIVMVLGTASCMITSVIALPSVLVWLKRSR